jgi:hypothetical protein
MICVACRRRHHEDCPGGTWCDCQHLPAAGTPAGTEAGASPGDNTARAAEPAMNWIHQG